MKVVINKCYGGFDLSPAAIFALVQKNSPALTKDSAANFTACKFTPTGGEYEFGNFISSVVKVDEFVYELMYGDCARSHPDLVAVVEKLGEAANGKHAELVIVEIPNGISWEIVDYDGHEHVAEKHRTWR